MNTKTPTQKLHLAIGIISTIFILVFILQNTEVVTVNFLMWKLEMSRVILILVLLMVGFVVGYIIGSKLKR